MTDQSIHLATGLSRPELIEITDAGQVQFYFGCDQDWYMDVWQRRAGCGPCTAATVLYYLARRKPGLNRLYTAVSHSREDFTRFMEEIWHYVTPGRMGVNEAAILSEGVRSYAATHKISLKPMIFKVPGIQQAECRPFIEFIGFIRTGLLQDCPVAFLNLSNGKLTNLDSWHWVTVTSLATGEDNTFQATISDSGERKEIDLELWHRTTLLGGSLVYFMAGRSDSKSLPEVNPHPE
jgi:hypothetical protein